MKPMAFPVRSKRSFRVSVPANEKVSETKKKLKTMSRIVVSVLRY